MWLINLMERTADGATYLQVVVMLAVFFFFVVPVGVKIVRDWFKKPPPGGYTGRKR